VVFIGFLHTRSDEGSEKVLRMFKLQDLREYLGVADENFRHP